MSERLLLHAGPLTAMLDGAELRWIRLGSLEVLRGIYGAVRELGWRTVPGHTEGVRVEKAERTFKVSFHCRHHSDPVHFDWEGRIEGRRDGTIRFSFDGVARSSFLRHRIGLCVLHSVEECAGRPCSVETVEGAWLSGVFPRLVSPHQPFLEIRAVRHQLWPGLEAEVRFEGEVFEMEDQRNWSDNSFKTYCTPLSLPYPVEVQKGTRIRQTVTLRLEGPLPPQMPMAADERPRVLVAPRRALARPRIGFGLAERPASGPEREALRALRPDHLRVELRLHEAGWRESLSRAGAETHALGSPLEAAVFLPEAADDVLAELAAEVRRQQVEIATWILLGASELSTAPGMAAAARRALALAAPEARYAGGTDRHFVELNRRRPATEGLDQVSFALTPQVHAFDDTTLVENLDSLPWLAESARAFLGHLPLAISPVTLRPRERPDSPRFAKPPEAPFSVDPRQRTSLASGWTLGFLAAAAENGISSLTFFETVGPKGVLDGDEVFPLYELFHALAWPAADEIVLARSSRPDLVRALALRSQGAVRLFLANVTAEKVEVVVSGLGEHVRVGPLGEAAGEPARGAVCSLDSHEVLQVAGGA
jgi:hypothetical protein